MSILVDSKNALYRPFRYDSEKEFESTVLSLADQIFGPSSVYVDVKKRVGKDVVSIPDGYVVDMAEPDDPKLFVVENEIVTHDPFKHIGIQMLKFVTSFEDAQLLIRKFLMEEIHKNPSSLGRLKSACDASTFRNIDAYLDKAVFGEFRGIVVIDEAQEELFRVLQKINANISVIELKTFVGAKGERIHLSDTLYAEYEGLDTEGGTGGNTTNTADRIARRKRRAQCDTIIVPARETGFKRVFLGENQWYEIRIGAAMKDRIRYIAAYQVAPVSAVTHIAEVQEIRPYKDSGRYVVVFKGPAEEIGPIPIRESRKSPQGPVYVRRDDLLGATHLEDAMET